MENLNALKNALVTASHILANEGLAQGFGHISIRIPGTDRFLIPPGMSPALVVAEDILTFDLGGNWLEGQKKPNSETWLHTCLYRARPDVGAVSHIHPPLVTALSATGQELKPLHNFGSVFPDGVRVFVKPGLINTEALANETAEMIGQNNALLLRGHGAIVAGPELRDACLWSIYLEEAAQMQIRATLLGAPLFYTREEALTIKNQVYRGRTIDRAWEFYLSRLPKA